MPIYAYRCATCGHAKDVLRKMSDPPLTECPACGASTFVKQVTAAGFQLKGSGWYVTDFRGGDTAKADAAKAAGGKPEAGAAEAGKSEAAPAAKADAAPAPSPATADKPAAAAPPPATGSK